MTMFFNSFAVKFLNLSNMITPANIAFTILIKVKGRLKEFNFRKRSDSNYDANTNDEYSNRYFFRMEKNDAVWKMIGRDLPPWLTESEDLIGEELSKKDQ